MAAVTVVQDKTNKGTTNTVSTGDYQVILNNTSTGNMTITNCIPSYSSSNSIKESTKIDLSSIKPTTSDAPKKGYAKGKKTGNVELLQQNENAYPPLVKTSSSGYGARKYNYEIDMQRSICDAIAQVKKDLNIPSAYDRRELNKLFHKKFNRFRIQYPDYFLNGTLAYVVMTRPDLNLFKSSDNLKYSNLHSQVLNDPQMYYIANADFESLKSLTKGYSSAHNFNPILSNSLIALDISDESIDTLETGETFTGFKTQYAKSNIRSMTAGTINLKFPETYNMSITHTHQLWCGYESNVYRGSMEPKSKYIWNKEIDYACDIYYFLLDKEDMIIRYWCKYTGCFPLNVNKSVFSYDAGSELNHPEISVTYSYFARDDMSVIALNEFNNDSGGISSGFKYKANYVPLLDSYGNTWSNAPFVEQIKVPNGLGGNSKLYALRFRK